MPHPTQSILVVFIAEATILPFTMQTSVRYVEMEEGRVSWKTQGPSLQSQLSLLREQHKQKRCEEENLRIEIQRLEQSMRLVEKEMVAGCPNHLVSYSSPICRSCGSSMSASWRVVLPTLRRAKEEV